MKKASVLASAMLLTIVTAMSAFGVLAEIPTAGLATTSVIVGAGGVIGGGWFTKALGIFAVGADPVGSTFYDGTIVMAYPSQYVVPISIGWFGDFAVDPNVPSLPVMTTAFFDITTSPYDLTQAPNPSLMISSSYANGVITVSFHAPSNGLAVSAPQGTPFNFLAISFQNISGQTLQWTAMSTSGSAAPSGSANLFDIPSQQVMTCKPDPSYIVPVTCGENSPTFMYTATPVPEPSTLLLFPAGFMVLGARLSLRRWRFRD